jgi:diguanylate cyclase (GGDEF)-like protein/PAS domain S-box-containing protein
VTALGASAPWPRAAVVRFLAVLAVGAALQQLLRPSWTAHAGPAALAGATAVVGWLVLRHSRRLDPLAATTWRGFAVIAGLLALGQGIRAVTGGGVNPASSGLSDLVLATTGPATVLVCVRLVRSTRGRIRHQVVLDAAVALTALGVLLVVLVPVAVGAAGAGGDVLLTVGYPLVSAVLCAVGLVTLGSVSPPRRAAAGWLLLGLASFSVVVGAGALGVGMPSPTLDVVAGTAYLALLAAATLALAADPGPQGGPRDSTVEVPLVGVVVSYCLCFGVLLLLLGGWAAGRPVVPLEAVSVAVLMLLTFVRTLVWAADSARLTRRLLRTEAYLRALVSSAEDVTVVLSSAGTVTWVSGAVHAQLGWTARELTGQNLPELIDPEDRGVVVRAAARTPDAADAAAWPVTVRMRSRDGDRRDIELSGVARSGVPGTALRDGLVLHLRDVTVRRSTQRELERMAYTDYLTGLPNRARFMAALDVARARAADGEPSCVLLVDLDGFKAVNDVAGHDAGDRLLCEVADLLRSGARDEDLVARLGGDEFALLVPGGIDEATGLAERLVTLLDRSFRVRAPDGAGPGPRFPVSGSIGLAPLQPDDEASAAVRQADLALRAAKAAGKRCVRSSDQAIDSAMGRRTRLARDLPAALEQQQLRVVYQPIVGLAERRVLGLEALVRWEHPLLGTILPDEFIGLAEDDGLIVPLQQWVLQAAATDAAALFADGWDLQLGVNVSVRHLQAGCLAPDVAHALAATGLPARKLVLEITESVMLDTQDRLESDLATLRDMGCVISLDDFGRGYSSLAYLARLPVDILKMDREFVAGIEGDPRGAALVASVIELGRTLGMDVVAEGVETAGQLAVLQGMHCRYAQGYLLGRPMPLGKLVTFLHGFEPGILDGAPAAEVDTGVHLVGRDG